MIRLGQGTAWKFKIRWKWNLEMQQDKTSQNWGSRVNISSSIIYSGQFPVVKRKVPDWQDSDAHRSQSCAESKIVEKLADTWQYSRHWPESISIDTITNQWLVGDHWTVILLFSASIATNVTHQPKIVINKCSILLLESLTNPVVLPSFDNNIIFAAWEFPLSHNWAKGKFKKPLSILFWENQNPWKTMKIHGFLTLWSGFPFFPLSQVQKALDCKACNALLLKVGSGLRMWDALGYLED